MATKKYPLGIAFSGGGAKAAAHCGALQALKEYGIKPDVVSGTSAGALVATLYASGFTPKQMVETFQGMNFFKDIVTPSVPKGGLFDSRTLVKLIQNQLPYNRLEEDKYKDNLVSVAYRSFLMMMVSNVAADTAQADLFIELDTYGCTAYDMSKIEELFFRGYDSTVKVLEQNGYQRVLPKEAIEFPKKKRKKDKGLYFIKIAEDAVGKMMVRKFGYS